MWNVFSAEMDAHRNKQEIQDHFLSELETIIAETVRWIISCAPAVFTKNLSTKFELTYEVRT